MSNVITSTIVRMVKGKPDAGNSLQQTRLLKCLDCKSRRQYWGGESCGEFLSPVKEGKSKTCGCDINEKVKYLDESCPQNKW